jgi:hypothetical protein
MSTIVKKGFATAMALFLFFGAFLVATVPASAASSRGADMTVVGTSITIPDTTPVVGDSINITCDVRNLGDEDGTDVTVTFKAINGTTVITFATYAMPVNVTNTTDVEAWGIWDSVVDAPDPTLDYTIEISATNSTDDNTTNDTAVAADLVNWEAPMLTVTDVTTAATAFLIGDDITISVEITNAGDAEFEGNQTVTLDYDSSSMDEYFNNTGGTPLAPAGTATVDFVVDTSGLSAGEVNFSSELNSVGEFLLLDFVEKITNVSVTAIATAPASLKATVPVTITASLANDGTMDAVDHDVVFKVGTTTVCTETLNVSIGATPDAECIWTPADSAVAVNYTITVETEAGANSMEKEVTVGATPAAMLDVTAIAFSPATLVAQDDVGDTVDVTVSVSVTNNGDAAAVNATLDLLVDGTVYASNTSVSLAIGASGTYDFTYVATTAEDDVEVNISAGEESKLLSIPGDVDAPDLVVDSVTYAPTVEQKDPLKITVVIANNGDADQVEEVEVALMVDTTEIGTVAFVNITAGGTNTTEFEWAVGTFAVGEYQVNATLGETYLLGENFTVTEYQVPILELEFAKKDDKVKNYKSSGAEGEKKKIKVELVLKNTGNAAASNVNVSVKDSKGNDLGFTIVPSVAAGGEESVVVEFKLKAGKKTGEMTASATADFEGETIADTNTAGEGAKATVEQTPGFEVVVLLAAVIVAIAILGRRRF